MTLAEIVSNAIAFTALGFAVQPRIKKWWAHKHLPKSKIYWI